MMESLLPNVNWEIMWNATKETLFMTGFSIIFTFILGIILGITLFLTDKGNMWNNVFLIESSVQS